MADSSKPDRKIRLSDRIKTIASRDPIKADAYVSVSKPQKRQTRNPAYKPAVLMLRGGEKLAVVIKNLSEAGAKVEFYKKVELPDRVRLVEQSIGLDVMADVVWRHDGMLGLTFIKR